MLSFLAIDTSKQQFTKGRRRKRFKWILKNLGYYKRTGNPLLLPSYIFKSVDIFPGNAVGNPVENLALDAKITARSAKHSAVDFFILSDDSFCLSTNQL